MKKVYNIQNKFKMKYYDTATKLGGAIAFEPGDEVIIRENGSDWYIDLNSKGVDLEIPFPIDKKSNLELNEEATKKLNEPNAMEKAHLVFMVVVLVLLVYGVYKQIKQ